MAKDEKKKIQATDPLEAAKISAKPPPEPVIAPPPPPPTFDSQPDAPMEVAPASASKRYRVKTTTTISLGGNITKLNEGDIVSAGLYGPDRVKLIIASGVPLVEI